jgi:co-chaperonin GroES (HSP10)
MSSVGYKPIMGRVLIKRDQVKTVSGIILPDEKKLNVGTVVAIGEAVDHHDIVVGARVHWGKGAGANINPEYLKDGKLEKGEEYFICMEEDILGVFETEQGK